MQYKTIAEFNQVRGIDPKKRLSIYISNLRGGQEKWSSDANEAMRLILLMKSPEAVIKKVWRIFKINGGDIKRQKNMTLKQVDEENRTLHYWDK